MTLPSKVYSALAVTLFGTSLTLFYLALPITSACRQRTWLATATGTMDYTSDDSKTANRHRPNKSDSTWCEMSP